MSRGSSLGILLLLVLAGCAGQPATKADACAAAGGCLAAAPDTCVDGAGAEVVCTSECSEPANGTRICPDAPLPVGLPWHPSDGASERTSIEVKSFDGHLIPVTVYRPLVANATVQVPVLLHSHGFTGSRANGDDAFRDHVAAGFGVVSFDERGHGDARGRSEVHFMHPDWEVRDVMAVIDTISSWDWVLMEDDATRDPVLGTIGYSYAGAFQLMGAIFDPRIDAIVPEITWHDVTEALAPNGAIKSGWVDLFYVAGNAQRSVTFSNDFHVGWAYANAANEFPAGQHPGVPDLYKDMKRSSPVSYPGQITVPTLLIQGMVDTLFPLNQAVDNLRMIEAAGAPVALSTHLGGHVLNTASLASQVPVPVGLQGVPGGEPCGSPKNLGIAWHQKWLLGLDVDTGPRICISLEDGKAVVGDAWPLPGTTMQGVDLGGPWPLVQAVGGSPVLLSVVEADKPMVVAGIPRVTGNLTAPGADTILYFSLQILRDGLLEHIVDDQVQPLRVAGPNTGRIPLDLELGGVGTMLQPGDELFLAISAVEPMYFANSGRIPTGTLLDDVRLELPVLSEPVFL